MAKKQIKFIEGETYCRYGSTLMTPEAEAEMFGFSAAETFNPIAEDIIVIDDVMYTDKDLCDIIKDVATFNPDIAEWDVVFNQGYPDNGYYVRKEFANTYTITPYSIEQFKGITKIKPFSDFKKEHPEIKLKEYWEFQDALDAYYDETLKN